MKNKIIWSIIAIGAGIYLQLRWQGIGIAFLFCFAWGIYEERLRAIEKNKQQDFLDVTEYMQSMGMSFIVSRSVYAALKETTMLFEEGTMKKALSEAISYIEDSRDGNAAETALHFLEKKYPCKKVQLLHRHLLAASNIGGDYHNSIRLLLRDQEMWKKRQILSNADLSRDRRKVGVAIGLTIGLCGYVSRLTGQEIVITDSPVYQTGMVMFILGCLAVWVFSRKAGRMDWLEENKRYSQEEILTKARQFHKETNQHKIGYRTRREVLRKEMLQAFPEWILEIALRIQNQNVEVALEDSYETAPAIIRPSLEELLVDLKEMPAQGEPFFRFGKEFQIPEIHTSMKMLYGISKGAISEAEDQLQELVIRNYRLEDQARGYEQEKRRSILFGYTLAPSLLGAGCMILNMSLLLIEFMKELSW